jgi:hypothetical protein
MKDLRVKIVDMRWVLFAMGRYVGRADLSDAI